MLALPTAAADGSANQQSLLQDNNLLLSDPGHLNRTLRTLRRIGVDRLRITVEWSTIAPDPNSRRRPPGFDAAEPASYPASGWARYDAITLAAARYGLALDFNVTGWAPLWAVGRAPARSMLHVWHPSASAFGAFVEAVGRRYNGTFIPPGGSRPLPRVNYWSIWNEPNVGSSSLSPQTINGVEVSPRLYRALLRAAYAALEQTGHGRDTILVGETASTGHLDPGPALGMPPLRFLRALYCVDSTYVPLRGRAAERRGCPGTAGGSRGFRAANPALFNATGWGHHPYNLTAAPDVPAPATEVDWVPLANLPNLERALDLVQRAYGSARRMPVYLTEYGFETNPPRADFTTTPALQAAYLNEAEYMAWRDPRVRVMTQYELQDPPPIPGSSGSPFASGLVFANGTKKPGFDAYRLPLWMPQVRFGPGGSLEVWGCVRPAKRIRRQDVRPVEIQLQGRTVRSVAVHNPTGYFDVRVRFPRGGLVRLVWRYPGGRTIYSRSVPITETAAGSGVTPLLLAAGCAFLLIGFVVLRRRRSQPTRAGERVAR